MTPEGPEIPPATPIPERGPIKTPAPESGLEMPAEFFNSDNQGFFDRMSERAQNFAHQAYEGIYNIPIVNRVVGKLEIAYNNFWSDRHEEKAIGLKEKMDGLSVKIGTFDDSKSRIEAAIADLTSQGVPGVESLQVKLKDLDRQKNETLNERDRVQSKFEARDNKIKLYTNERDRVADKLIGHYSEKLKPMEKEFGTLYTCRDQADLSLAVLEAKQQEQIEKLDNFEKRKQQIEEALRATGMTEKQIAKFEAVKALGSYIDDGHKSIQSAKEQMTARVEQINKRIAKVDAKANPYRDKREEFARIKEGRPIKIHVETRQRGEEFRGSEETEGHTRSEAPETKERETESKTEITAEKKDKEKNRATVEDFIAAWNSRDAKEDTRQILDPKDFYRVTTLSAKFKLEAKDFKSILGKYYKLRKIPVKEFERRINGFLKKFSETLTNTK